LTIVPLIGFYDGLFGPGAGSFYVIGFIALLGFGIIKATAHTKLANAASNVGGLALYAATGAVVWPIGLAMAVFAFLGAQIGSRLAMRIGARLIKPMLVLISCAMAARLLADPSNPIRMAISSLASH
ncbi:MAG: TSUP family transporter, partial [Rhodoblastus sp.]